MPDLFENEREGLTEIEDKIIDTDLSKSGDTAYSLKKANLDYLKKLYDPTLLRGLEEKVSIAQQEEEVANNEFKDAQDSYTSLQEKHEQEIKSATANLEDAKRALQEKKDQLAAEEKKLISDIREKLNEVKNEYIITRQSTNMQAAIAKLPSLNISDSELNRLDLSEYKLRRVAEGKSQNQLEKLRDQHIDKLFLFMSKFRPEKSEETKKIKVLQVFYKNIALNYLQKKMEKLLQEDIIKMMKDNKISPEEMKDILAKPLAKQIEQLKGKIKDTEFQDLKTHLGLLNDRMNEIIIRLMKIKSLTDIKNLETYLQDLKSTFVFGPNKDKPLGRNQDTQVINLIIKLYSHSNHEALEKALLEYRTSLPKKNPPDPTSLSSLMPDPTQAFTEQPMRGLFEGYSYEEDAPKDNKEMSDYKLHAQVIQTLNNQEMDAFTADPALRDALVRASQASDEEAAREILQPYFNIIPQTQQQVIIQHLQALRAAPLNAAQSEHIAQLDRLVESRSSTNDLIAGLKSFTYATRSNDPHSLKARVHTAAQQIEAEVSNNRNIQVLRSDIVDAQRLVDQRAGELQTSQAENPELLAARQQVSDKQSTLDKRKQETTQATQTLVEAQQKIQTQEQLLTQMLLNQLIYAAERYLRRMNGENGYKPSMRHSEAGKRDARALQSQCEELLKKQPPATWSEATNVAEAMLKKSNLYNNSCGTIILEVLYNEGTPPGVFNIDLTHHVTPTSAAEQKRQGWVDRGVDMVRQNVGAAMDAVLGQPGCPKPADYFKAGGKELKGTPDFGGSVQKLIHKKPPLVGKNHRKAIRDKAITNLQDLVGIFDLSHTQTLQVHTSPRARAMR
jgi:hypothetical protein